MLNKKMLTVLTAAGLLGGAGLCAARAQHGPDGGWHHDPLFAGVTLTDAQQQQIGALHKASWQNNKALFTQVRAIDEKIETTLLSSGTVTEATLAPLVQQKAALMQQLDTSRLSQQIAERNLLTDSQLSTASATHAKLTTLHAQERALHGQTSDAPPPPPDAN